MILSLSEFKLRMNNLSWVAGKSVRMGGGGGGGGGLKKKKTLIASRIPIIFGKEQLSKFFCDTIKEEWVKHNAVTNFYSWCIYFIFSFIKCASQNYYNWDYPQTVTFEQWN